MAFPRADPVVDLPGGQPRRAPVGRMVAWIYSPVGLGCLATIGPNQEMFVPTAIAFLARGRSSGLRWLGLSG